MDTFRIPHTRATFPSNVIRIKIINQINFSGKDKLWRSSLVGIATMRRAARSGFRIPVDVKDFSILQNVQTESGAHPLS
jgi:hypothetical protein